MVSVDAAFAERKSDKKMIRVRNGEVRDMLKDFKKKSDDWTETYYVGKGLSDEELADITDEVNKIDKYLDETLAKYQKSWTWYSEKGSKFRRGKRMMERNISRVEEKRDEIHDLDLYKLAKNPEYVPKLTE
jgi:hypothetical protein